MRTHQEIDERSLALARAIAEKIDVDPERRGLERARRVCERWKGLGSAPDVDAWGRILQLGWTEVRDALLADTEEGRRLRQSSPFCGVLDPRERWAVYRRYRTREPRTA